MKTYLIHRNDPVKPPGLCVVIDVLRAFTTAAFAFHGGAKEIILVSTVQEALQKHAMDQSLVLMGEVEGKYVEGFHYGNSPAEIQKGLLQGKTLVQRTSSGTQGVVGCQHASQMLIASFVVAEATLRRIKFYNPKEVSFIITGRNNGDEDLALAEYLEKRLLGEKVSVAPYLKRVSDSPTAYRITQGELKDFGAGQEDLNLAVHLDRFDFAMEVFKREGNLVAVPTN